MEESVSQEYIHKTVFKIYSCGRIYSNTYSKLYFYEYVIYSS